jgi:hypothetical protein
MVEGVEVPWYGHRLGAVEGCMVPGFVPWFLEIVFRDLGQFGLNPWTDGAWEGMVSLVCGVGVVTWLLMGGGLATESVWPVLCAIFLLWWCSSLWSCLTVLHCDVLVNCFS